MTQANQVFLMEPGFNPALEQQAIGRVHRLGQKREVEIVRLLVKDSVETRIGAFLEKKYGKKSDTAVDEDDKESAVVGPVGNVATEKPKSKIMAEEFDILFGVQPETGSKSSPGVLCDPDEAMPDAALSGGFI